MGVTHQLEGYLILHNDIIFCVVSLQKPKRDLFKSVNSKSHVLSIDFTLLLSFLKVLVEYVNNYDALLFVEFMKSIAELISVVKLSDFVLMLWF